MLRITTTDATLSSHIIFQKSKTGKFVQMILLHHALLTPGLFLRTTMIELVLPTLVSFQMLLQNKNLRSCPHSNFNNIVDIQMLISIRLITTNSTARKSIKLLLIWQFLWSAKTPYLDITSLEINSLWVMIKDLTMLDHYGSGITCNMFLTMPRPKL